jgi:hypothetical protein
MVCSPEQARLNGAKSKGAITDRGRAIASRNATKHGLLAKHPPLLVTEDLSTFEGLAQGLIEHYQPENPVENFLIQQVAMGMLKQYRLWSVEAAIANIEILKAQRQAKFPDHVVPAKINLADWDEFAETRIPLKVLLEKEKSVLQRLMADLEHDLANAQNRGESKTLEAFGESLRQNRYHEDRQASVWQFQDEVDEWLAESWNGRKKRYTADFQAAIVRVSQLVELAKRRIGELDQALEEMEATEREIQQAELVSKGMQHQELFSRYQRNINRELYEAIDRLEEMRKQRQSQSSMGSFRQISSEQRMFQ